MKLHEPERYNGSCGLTAIAILTGEPFDKISRRILRFRRKYPRDYYGKPCPKSKMMTSTSETFLSELKRCLAQKFKLGKFKKFGGKIKRFAEEHPTGIFFLNFPKHVAIFKDGMVYDNGGEAGPWSYRFAKDTIESFATIKSK